MESDKKRMVVFLGENFKDAMKNSSMNDVVH